MVNILETTYSSLPNNSNANITLHRLKFHVIRHWVIYFSIGALLASVLFLLQISFKENNGHIVYALDDAYIHMAMAKNLAQHGVFGVTKYEFSSSSSSILWSLLLSASFWVFGLSELAPLILNLVFASALLILIYLIMKKFQLGSLLCLFVLLSVVFLTPLSTLILTGLEHVLQVLIDVAFVFICATLLKNPDNKQKLFWTSILLSAFVTMVRFEGIFLVFAVFLLYVIQKNLKNALIVGLAGILPILLFGIISMYNGWLFLPNSVIIKGNFPDLNSVKGIIAFLGLTCYRRLAWNPHILILIMSTMFLVIRQYNRDKTIYNDRLSLMSSIFLITTVLHLQFAGLGWLYRYEGYIVVLGLLITGIFINTFLKNSQGKILYSLIILFILITSSPLGVRALEATKQTPQAMADVYQQQYQMGLFLNKFYKGTSIAVNDIGAIGYLSDNRILDVFGLASLEVGKAVKTKDYNTELIYNLSKKQNVKIAVVYENYGDEYDVGDAGIPSNWQKVGEWKTPNIVVSREDTVSFFAVNSYEAETLAENLKKFSVNLPSGVEQKILIK